MSELGIYHNDIWRFNKSRLNGLFSDLQPILEPDLNNRIFVVHRLDI